MRTKLIAATAAIALAAVAATPASARWHHHYHHGFGAPLAGFAAGAIIGGALAAQGPYYGSGYYGAPAYAYSPGGGSVAYCEQRFKSYDPGSGTYLGYDGYRHSCP